MLSSDLQRPEVERVARHSVIVAMVTHSIKIAGADHGCLIAGTSLFTIRAYPGVEICGDRLVRQRFLDSPDIAYFPVTLRASHAAM